MKNLILLFSIPTLVLIANVVNAFDFYGASVTTKVVSMSMWRMGINGNYPVIDSVNMNSPAAKAGLSEGNIILSVNGRATRNVYDLDNVSTDVISVEILKGYSREKIIIDRAAVENEKIKRIAENMKPIVDVSGANTGANFTEKKLDSAPIILNDAVLEKKLGGSMSVNRTGNNDTYKEIGYFETCKSILKVVLKAPSTANFLSFANSDRHYRSGYFVISSFVDSQNSFGAFLRAPWSCTIDFQLNRVKDVTFRDKDIVRNFVALPNGL